MTGAKTILAFAAGLAISAAIMVGAHADSPFMTLGAYTTQPIGHFDYCRRAPQDCAPSGAMTPGPIALTAETMGRVARINRTVNATIAAESDLALYGQDEHWAIPTTAGDCEDYALLKRQRLIALGIPAGNLLMTVVRKRNGDGHAVLTLTSQEGDFVLDNLDSRVRSWSQTPYRYLKRQDAADPGRWVTIRHDRSHELLVAATSSAARD